MQRILLMLSVGLLLAPRAASAQDTPRFGIVMGYPAQVGVLWTVFDRLAIRPEVNWTRTTTESTATTTVFNGTGVTTTLVTTSSESNAIGGGVSALFYVSRRDALGIYLAPRYAYSHSATSNDLALPASIPVPAPTETTTTSHTVSGSIGAQYGVAKHFGIFGELGLQYGHTTISPLPSILRAEARQTNTGLRSGAGVILFFGS